MENNTKYIVKIYDDISQFDDIDKVISFIKSLELNDEYSVSITKGKVYNPIHPPKVRVEFLKSDFFDSKDDIQMENIKRLILKWKESTEYMSSITQILNDPNYLKIMDIALSDPKNKLIVLGVIIQDLTHNGGFWFKALRDITGEDPVPQSSKGNIKEMRQSWLNWAYFNMPSFVKEVRY